MRGTPFIGHHIADPLASQILVEGEQFVGLCREPTLVVVLEIWVVRRLLPFADSVTAGPLRLCDPAVPRASVDVDLPAVRQDPLLLVALIRDEPLVSERRAFEQLVRQPAQTFELRVRRQAEGVADGERVVHIGDRIRCGPRPRGSGEV